MAPIYEEIVLAWQDAEYTIRPDFRMVQRIEARGISIVGVCEGIRLGKPLTSQVAEIVAHMLQSGGAKTAIAERVYAHLNRASEDEWLRIYWALTTAFFPKEEESSGNSGGREGAADSQDSETTEPQ